MQDDQNTRLKVVALHCSGARGTEWLPLAEATAGFADIDAPDLLGTPSRGHWVSDAPFTLADEARPIIAGLDASDQPAHLAGHSFGAAVALHIARLRPDLVASLCLYEPTSFHTLNSGTAGDRKMLAEARSLSDAISSLVASGAAESAAAMFADYWTGSGSWGRFHARQQQAMAGRIAKIPHDFEAIFNEPAAASDYAEILAPVTIITGSETRPQTRRISELLRQNIPQCRHQMIKGAGHMGPVTHAGPVAGAMAGHLRRFVRP